MVPLSVDDRFLSAYLFYGSLLMLKTWVMSFLTARHRIQNKVCNQLKCILLSRVKCVTQASMHDNHESGLIQWLFSKDLFSSYDHSWFLKTRDVGTTGYRAELMSDMFVFEPWSAGHDSSPFEQIRFRGSNRSTNGPVGLFSILLFKGS